MSGYIKVLAEEPEIISERELYRKTVVIVGGKKRWIWVFKQEAKFERHEIEHWIRRTEERLNK
jgi:hypothetical protein